MEILDNINEKLPASSSQSCKLNRTTSQQEEHDNLLKMTNESVVEISQHQYEPLTLSQMTPKKDPRLRKEDDDFDVLLEQFMREYHIPDFIKDDANLLLQKAKDMKNKAKQNKKSGLHKCPFCLQCYLSHTQLLKHQKRKTDCIKGNFILKTIAMIPKFESILDVLVEINYSQDNLDLIEAMYNLKSLFITKPESPLLSSTIHSIEGPLVDSIAQILFCMKPGQTIQQFPGIDGVTSDTIKTLLHGVYLNSNTQTRLGILFNKPAAWLQDQHMEIFRLLLLQNYDGSHRLSGQVPMMLSSQIFKELSITKDKTKCVQQFREDFESKGIFKGNNILCKEILLPVNINENHWILLYINISNLTYCPINPFCPSQPQKNDVLKAKEFMTDFANILGTQKYHLEVPQLASYFPKQEDGFNCGMYVLLYILGFISPNLVTEEGFPLTVMEYRVLMAGWFLSRITPSLIGSFETLDSEQLICSARLGGELGP